MTNTQLSGADQHPLHSDSELMRRWFTSQLRTKVSRTLGRGIPLWSKVAEVFGIGSTSAKDVCRRHGCDPDRLMRRSP